jgi:hypothetical protein
MKRSRHQFNMALNDDDYRILKTLKDKYSININGCFKNFLRRYLKTLDDTELSLVCQNKSQDDNEKQKKI